MHEEPNLERELQRIMIIEPIFAPNQVRNTVVVKRAAEPTDVRVRLTETGLIPPKANTVLLDVAALSASQAGFVTVYDCDLARPNTATVNFTRLDDGEENQAYVPLSADGSICIHRSTAVSIELTLFGWQQ